MRSETRTGGQLASSLEARDGGRWFYSCSQCPEFLGELGAVAEDHAPLELVFIRPMAALDFSIGLGAAPRLLGIAVGEQLHRAFEISEKHRNLLPLTLQSALGGQDLLSEVLGV